MKRFGIGLMITLIGLFSCRLDKVEPSAFDQQSYPLNVGNWWRYNVTDLRKQTSKTLLLRIVSKQTNNDVTTYRCNLEQNGNIVDSAQMILSPSALLYKGLGADDSFFGDFKLKLPFQKGETWEGMFPQDKIEVVAFKPDYVVLGQKCDLYDIKRAISGFNYRFNQNLQLAKGIGIVSQYIDSFDSATVEQHLFELVDYKLN
jgi:hypothetical protein